MDAWQQVHIPHMCFVLPAPALEREREKQKNNSSVLSRHVISQNGPLRQGTVLHQFARCRHSGIVMPIQPFGAGLDVSERCNLEASLCGVTGPKLSGTQVQVLFLAMIQIYATVLVAAPELSLYSLCMLNVVCSAAVLHSGPCPSSGVLGCFH